jgi:hypothetical protein
VSYRDDVDAIYLRASALQREVDLMQAKLAERDAELAAMRGQPVVVDKREWRSTSAPPLRELPAAETLLSSLIETFAARTPPPVPRTELLAAARDRLGELDAESLVLVGAIIEELAMEPARRGELHARLRPIVREIAGSYSTAP